MSLFGALKVDVILAGYWFSQQNTPRRRAWAGYAFGSLCLKHALRLKAALGIAGVETKKVPWYLQHTVKSEIPGAQISVLSDSYAAKSPKSRYVLAEYTFFNPASWNLSFRVKPLEQRAAFNLSQKSCSSEPVVDPVAGGQRQLATPQILLPTRAEWWNTGRLEFWV